jgi:hypothetical protein
MSNELVRTMLANFSDFVFLCKNSHKHLIKQHTFCSNIVDILQLSFVTPLGNWKQPLGTFMLLASDGSDCSSGKVACYPVQLD